MRQEAVLSVTQAETLPRDPLARPRGTIAKRQTVGITVLVLQTKLRPRETSQ